MKPFIFGSILFLGLVSSPGRALAHMIETDYQLIYDSLEIQSLEIQSVFSTGEVFPNAPIVVYSPEDPTTPWLEGTTDESGKFVFDPDPAIAGEWSVEIGEDSHWDRLRIPVGDRGIDFDAITYLDGHTPHRHHPFADQLIVAGAAICSAIGGQFLGHKLKRR
ncbi:MAG: hypothetical protein AAFW84_09230 [Cyanobacteria bacterium J06635_15]